MLSLVSERCSIDPIMEIIGNLSQKVKWEGKPGEIRSQRRHSPALRPYFAKVQVLPGPLWEAPRFGGSTTGIPKANIHSRNVDIKCDKYRIISEYLELIYHKD